MRLAVPPLHTEVPQAEHITHILLCNLHYSSTCSEYAGQPQQVIACMLLAYQIAEVRLACGAARLPSCAETPGRPQVLKLVFCARMGSGAALLAPGFSALRKLDLSWCSAVRSESLRHIGCVMRPPHHTAAAQESTGGASWPYLWCRVSDTT